jgi:hypothetical protein
VLELDLETLFESPRADTAVPALVVRTANSPLSLVTLPCLVAELLLIVIGMPMFFRPFL